MSIRATFQDDMSKKPSSIDILALPVDLIDISAVYVDKVRFYRHIGITCRFGRHVVKICRYLAGSSTYVEYRSIASTDT